MGRKRFLVLGIMLLVGVFAITQLSYAVAVMGDARPPALAGKEGGEETLKGAVDEAQRDIAREAGEREPGDDEILASGQNLSLSELRARVITTTEELVMAMLPLEREELIKLVTDEDYILCIATQTRSPEDLDTVIETFLDPETVRKLIEGGQIVFSLVTDTTIWTAIEELAQRAVRMRTLDNLTEDQIGAISAAI